MVGGSDPSPVCRKVEPGKVFALCEVQKGFLERADLWGICKTKVLLQDRCLMPRSSFLIFGESLGDEQVPFLSDTQLLPFK